jgi:hypothetical protein
MFVIALSPLIVIPDEARSVFKTIKEAVFEKVAAAGKWL